MQTNAKLAKASNRCMLFFYKYLVSVVKQISTLI